jgi:twitching motility protein PilT
MDYTTNLDTLLSLVLEQGASDLHLSVGRHPIVRVRGELIQIENYPALLQEDLMGLLSTMVTDKKIAQLAERVEIDFGYNFHGKMRLRGNAFIRSGSLSIALRVIEQVRTLTDLKLPDALAEFTRAKQGFFLVVGPVGQGKSTTLAAMIDLINTERPEHIVTIEHPIEYLHHDKRSIIDQREVGIDTPDFTSALESVFRQDVNVIMIGEMRDPDTMRTAVTAAETGHLVFSTLHTNNAAQTIDRIIDTFPPEQQDQIRVQLAGSLLGIFSQRLIPSLRGGLAPAYELLVNTRAVANLIRDKRTHEIDNMIETGLEHGMVSMNRALIELVRAGDITIEDAKRVSSNPQGLEGMLG